MFPKAVITFDVRLRSQDHKLRHWIAELAKLQEDRRLMADTLLCVGLTAGTRNDKNIFRRLGRCDLARVCSGGD